MRYAGIILLVGLVVCIGWLFLAGRAGAVGYEGVSAKHAAQHVRVAERELVRAKAALSEARHVQSATEYYSTHDYTDFAGRYVDPEPVGRWVWLALDTGWGWGQIDMLSHIIARESSGFPGVKNPTSTATGLLQMLKAWWDGTWFGWVFDPTVARNALKYGWKAFHEKGLGWQPWIPQ